MIDPITNPDPVGWHTKINQAVDYWEGSPLSAGLGSFGDARLAMNDLAGDMGLPTVDLADSTATKRSKMNAIIAALGLPAGLDMYADFTTGRYWDNGPQVVASEITDTWSGGPLPDADGVYSSFATNALARNGLGLWTQPGRTNYVPNNTWVGASPGAPGVAPNLMTAPAASSGLSREIVGTGTNPATGLPYVRIRYSGTTTAATFMNILPISASTPVAAINAQPWANSVYLSLVAGSFSGLTSAVLSGALYNGTSYIGVLGASVSLLAMPPVATRFTQLATTNRPETTGALPYIQINFLVGAVIDFTIQIEGWQFEQGAFATLPILTSSAATARTGNRQVIDLTGRLEYGVAGFVKVDLRALIADRFILHFGESSTNRIGIVRSSGGNVRLFQTAGVVDGDITGSALVAGVNTIAFAAGAGFMRVRVVGGAASSSASPASVASMTKLAIGGRGYTDDANNYQTTKKLGLIFGTPDRPINQALFDQVYALAEAA